MGRKKTGYNAPEGLVRLPPSPFWWVNFTHNGKLIRESTKTKNLDEATKILQEVKKSLSARNPRSEAIVNRYLEKQKQSKV